MTILLIFSAIWMSFSLFDYFQFQSYLLSMKNLIKPLFHLLGYFENFILFEIQMKLILFTILSPVNLESRVYIHLCIRKVNKVPFKKFAYLL